MTPRAPRVRTRLRVVTSSGRPLDPAVREAEGKLREALQHEMPVVSVAGPAGAGKSALVHRALARHGHAHAVWLDLAVASSPAALFATLAFRVGLAPESGPSTLRRHLEGGTHVIVADGLHGPSASLEPALAELVSGKTRLVVIGRAPELSLLPALTLRLAASTPGRLGVPLRGRATRTWLEAMAALGGGVSVEDAVTLGRLAGVAEANQRLVELLRAADAVAYDPHEPRHVRLNGRLRRALVGAAEPQATRAAIELVCARALAPDDGIDFEDAPRRVGLMPHAAPEAALVMARAAARWAVRWRVGAGSGATSLVDVLPPEARRTATFAALEAAAEALRGERWADAVAAFGQADVATLSWDQRTGRARALLELGRHAEAETELGRPGPTPSADGALDVSLLAALVALDRGALDGAEVLLTRTVLEAATRGRRRQASQARFWLLCIEALRSGGVEAFHASAVAAELLREGEHSWAAFARALATRGGAPPPVNGESAATRAAIDVLHGRVAPDDTGLLVRVAKVVRRVVSRAGS